MQSLGRDSKDVSMDKIQQESLVVSSSDNVVRKTPTHRHALLLVNQQRILLHFNVFLKPLFVSQQVRQSFVPLSQFVLQQFDALRNFRDFLQQLVVRPVVTGLHLGPAGSFFQPGLRHPQGRVLGGYIGLQTLNVSFLLSNFLKDVKLLKSCGRWEVKDRKVITDQ